MALQGSSSELRDCRKTGVSPRCLEWWFQGIVLDLKVGPKLAAPDDYPPLEENADAVATEVGRLVDWVRYVGVARPENGWAPSRSARNLAKKLYGLEAMRIGAAARRNRPVFTIVWTKGEGRGHD